jgi:hypothetical protein
MDARANVPGLNRRGFLGASAVAAGLGAGLAASGPAAAGTAGPRAAAASTASGSPGQAATSLTEAVLAAFRTHRVVAISDTHGGQETHDLLLTMLSDPRLYGTVNDIIFEIGNPFYQDTLDRFILGDGLVNDADLRLVWRNCIESPSLYLDSPIYEQIYRRIRAVNWTLPPEKRIRLLAADSPPLDWSTVTSPSQIPDQQQRNTYAASLAVQSLASGRRVLLFYGADHLWQTKAANYGYDDITTLIEEQTGIRAYVILDLMPLATDPGGVFAKLAAYPRGTVIPAAGTWLGKVGAGDVLAGVLQGQNGKPPTLVNPWCGMTMGELVDAGLYLGQAAQMTQSVPNPAIYLDPVYWAELQRRNAIQGESGVSVDLDTFRQQQPPAFPLPQAGPACSTT